MGQKCFQVRSMQGVVGRAWSFRAWEIPRESQVKASVCGDCITRKELAGRKRAGCAEQNSLVVGLIPRLMYIS